MRVCVLGVGLIGGSAALAARRRLGAHVSGWDPDPAALQDAVDRGVLDAALGAPEDGADADAWIVAAPVDAVAEVVARALAAARPDALVTDVASVKVPVVAAIDDERFVAGHPLAGAETGGVAHAREDLFDGAVWYLTPTDRTSGVCLERAHRLIAGLGAAPVVCDPADHDRLMAAISHLPHIVANVLIERAAAAGPEDQLPPIGPSFRDATRVAGANPPLWGQIYAANAEALGAELDATIERLQTVRDSLDDLEAWQGATREQRARLLGAAAQGGPTTELRVAVPNRPGVVADLTLTLGRAGINIADMSLAPSPDLASGVVALWVPERDVERARGLIGEKGLLVS